MAGGALRQAEHSLNFAQVVVLMVDAQVSAGLDAGLTRRELALASSIVREGRSLLIALNKLDLLSDLDRDKVQFSVCGRDTIASYPSAIACCCSFMACLKSMFDVYFTHLFTHLDRLWVIDIRPLQTMSRQSVTHAAGNKFDLAFELNGLCGAVYSCWAGWRSR